VKEGHPQGSEKPGFLGFIGFWALLGFQFNEWLGSSSVDLPHQLSFYLDSPVLQILKFASSLLVGR